MVNPFVINASPLIFLSQAGLLDLLNKMTPSAVVTQVVLEELDAGAHIDATAEIVRQTSWITVVETPEIPDAITLWDLGVGESSVLAWAYSHYGTEAVIDDLQARRCAATLNIPVRGTLGLIIIAKKRGLIPNARPVIEKLIEAGMYLPSHVVDQALRSVNE